METIQVGYCKHLDCWQLAGQCEQHEHIPRVIQLTQTDPFERGCHLGALLRSDIQEIYAFIGDNIKALSPLLGEDVIANLSCSDHLPDHIKREMEGIAFGAGVEFTEVVRVHAFVDAVCALRGCSALGAISSEGRNGPMSTAATDSWCCDWADVLANHPLTTAISSYQEVLRVVNDPRTIQAVVFDINAREVYIANEPGDAALSKFRTYSPFSGGIAATRTARLARNLDWSWTQLAHRTILVCTPGGDGRHSFVNVTFPGFVGVLTGMNECGVALACCTGGKGQSQNNCEPVTILFRRVLENASTAGEAERLLASPDTKPACAMKLAVAAPDNAFTVILDPELSSSGYVDIQRALPSNI